VPRLLEDLLRLLEEARIAVANEQGCAAHPGKNIMRP
jgi:hypothetical protein